MAQRQHGVVPDQDHYCCCTICLGRLTEPVTLPCGHSYCRSCIEVCWDQQGEQKRDYSCPQCRETFSPRPVLRKNNILAEVVENLRCTGGQSSAAEAKSDRATARLQDITCSSHNEPKKVYCRTDQQCICLLCAMDHHKGHDTVSTLAERTDKQKQVVTSQQEVQQKIQERKKELKDLRPSIETLKSSAEAAADASDKIFGEMISSVERTRRKVKELIRDQEKTAVAHAERLQRSLEEQIAQLERRNAELEELSSADDIHFIQSFRSLSMSTASPVFVPRPLTSFTDVSEAVSGLRDILEDMLKTTWLQISDRAPDGAPPPQVYDHLQGLPPRAAQSLSSLFGGHPTQRHQRRGGSRTRVQQDHLQDLPPMSWSSSEDDSSEEEGAAGPPTTTWQTNQKRATQWTMSTIPGPTARKHGVPTRWQADSPKPQTRKDFLQYFHPLTLDTNTAHRNLRLSENNRKVTWGSLAQSYPAHPDRFDDIPNVMCTKGLTGRCYWEAEWSGTVDIAVIYREFNRKGRQIECYFGWDKKSWTLECYHGDNKFKVRHNRCLTELTVHPNGSHRVAVYLDYAAGALSFYRVSSDTLTHLYTFQNTFTQPLYPAFFTRDSSSSVSLCQER